MNLDNPRVIDVHNYRYLCPLSNFNCYRTLVLLSALSFLSCFCDFRNSIFVATWNVGGRSPPQNMNLDDWLHASPPADIYVLGYDLVIHHKEIECLYNSIICNH